MSDLLDNELVRKYFAVECYNDAELAREILRAMQEPIRKGERYLVTYNGGKSWQEETLTHIEADEPYHPNLLRLPDRFQTERKECGCTCHEPKGLPLEHSCCTEAVSHPAKPSERTHPYVWKGDPSEDRCSEGHLRTYDPCTLDRIRKPSAVEVEAKIKEIAGYFEYGDNLQFKHLLMVGLEDTLRALVELVRKESK